jgi:ATP-dependent Clp protease ATP-binding subunit ClpC
MYERFTDRARKVMQLANQEAQRFNHEYIGTEHILLGLVKEGSGTAAHVLKNLDIDLRKIRLEIEKVVQSGPDMVTMGKLPQTPRAKKVIEYSIEEARFLNHNYVGTEHLLLGLVREQEGVAAQVLMNLGLKLEDVREEVMNLLGQDPELLPSPSGRSSGTARTPTLDTFGLDLTDLAQRYQLAPSVGRHNEIERMLLVLGCRSVNNPLLVGPTGAGRRSIVRGLARRSAAPDAPEPLRGRRVVELRQAKLITHPDYITGKFTEVIRGLCKECRRAGNVILFIDDLFAFRVHGCLLLSTLMDAGVPCISVATPELYRAEVVDNPVFGPRFQAVHVEPASPEDARHVLFGLREHLQSQHALTIGDDAVAAAVQLADRHLTDGCLPGKAVALLEQAAVLYRLKNTPPPPDTSALDAQIAALLAVKEESVAAQDFEKAARARDQHDKLVKERERRLREARELPPIAGALGALTVEEVIGKLTGVQFRGSDAIRTKPEGM